MDIKNDTFVPVVERLHGGKPIIVKDETHDWENTVTFNPACALLTDLRVVERLVEALGSGDEVSNRIKKEAGVVIVLYRAQGKPTPSHDHTRSTLGLAVCSPTLEVLLRVQRPVLFPDREYDNLGVEDPRVTRIGDTFCMVYCGDASAEGGNRVRICIATSEDLVHWTKHGPLNGAFNQVNNKNGMLFDPAGDGRLMILHRPMEGRDAMMVHWAEGNSVFGEWKTRGVLLPWQPNPSFKDVWVGGGAPPLRLSDGRYLMLYHIGNRDVAGKREYDLGLALLDPSATEPVVRRIEPLLRPGTSAETEGDADLGVNNVVFVCGAYFWEGDLYFPYAGADSCVLGGRIRRSDIERFTER